MDDLTPVVKEAVDKARVKLSDYPVIGYIAGALTEVDETTKTRYGKTTEICRTHGIFAYAPHLHGTGPIKNPDVSPLEVRDIDFLWAVVVPGFHVNFLLPKAANWTEEGWGEDHFIPTIYCLPKDEKLSRLIRGMRNIFSVIQYRNLEECYRKLDILFRLVSNWQTHNPGKPFIEFVKTHYPFRIELEV